MHDKNAAVLGQIVTLQGHNAAMQGQNAARKCNLQLCMRRMQ